MADDKKPPERPYPTEDEEGQGMPSSFLPGFSLKRSPLQNDAVRARLAQAILDGDPAAFRATLEAASSELVGEHRLYGVLKMTAEGMRPVLVDEMGQPVGDPGYVIAANTPIDLLNVQQGESEVTVTIGKDVWKAPCRPADQSSAADQPGSGEPR